MEYIIPIVLVIAVLVAFSFVWFKKSEPSEDQEESIEVFADKIIVGNASWRNPPPNPKPYFDETHFYFKGSSSPVIAMGNYLPLIPVVCDGNQRLRYTTKNGLEGIMKLSDLERAIYFPAVDPETLKTKDSTNG